MVTSVLRKELPILKHKIMRLDENVDVKSNFSLKLGEQDMADQAVRDFGVHKMPEEEFEKMQAKTKQDQEDMNLVDEDWSRLNGKYQAMKRSRGGRPCPSR